jgi:RHS repeat-associated protein
MVNNDPDGDGNDVTLNVRFPGQYYDRETGLHYNYFRNYNPSTGRYIQSDPIGLTGGLNNYLYSNANPINEIDPLGLDSYRCRRTLGRNPGEGPLYGRATQHWFSCVIDNNGTSECGGQTASGSIFGSPGRATTPQEDYYHPKACEKSTDNNSCFDQCLIDEWAKPRPHYDLDFWPGKQCQQYDSDVNRKCRKKCGLK